MIDICGVSAVAFKANLHKEENVFFVTSLSEIDCELKACKHEICKPVDITLKENTSLQ
jgi:hypothetical protein